jgi:hypothetical protein
MDLLNLDPQNIYRMMNKTCRQLKPLQKQRKIEPSSHYLRVQWGELMAILYQVGSHGTQNLNENPEIN